MRVSPFDLVSPRHQVKAVLIGACSAVFLLGLDTSIIRVYYFEINSLFGGKEILFLGILVLSIIAQYIVIESTKRAHRSKNADLSNLLKVLDRVVAVAQAALVAILLFIITEMFLNSSYRVSSLIVVTVVSYLLAIILMTLLASRFFTWFRSYRNMIMLLYGISFISICFNAVFAIVSVFLALQNQPQFMVDRGGYVTPFYSRNPILPYVNYSYLFSSMTSFVLTWIPTAFLLRHHVQNVKGAVFWPLITLPLAFFLIQFQPVYSSVLSEFSRDDPVTFGVLSTLLSTWSRPVGGVIFGVVFFVIAAKVHGNTGLRTFAIISGCGYMLLFASNQAIVLISAPYPPFGVITISFLGLSTYLILSGIYSSAISMSEEISLRKIVRRTALKELSLLGSIGVAERDHEISKKVVSIAKQHADKMFNESGIRSTDENDLKQYLDDVLREIEKKKSTNPN